MTLAEFLLARISEEEGQSRREWLAELPDTPEAEAVAAWDKLMVTQALRYNIAVRQLGVCIVAAFGWQSRLRLLAVPYADHPDYHQEWKI